MNVDKFLNGVASLFRVFMELSLDHYIQVKGIKISKGGKSRSIRSSLKKYQQSLIIWKKRVLLRKLI